MQRLPAECDATASTVVETKSGVSTASEVDGVWPSNSLVQETTCPSIVSTTISPTCLGLSRRERPFLASSERAEFPVQVSLGYEVASKEVAFSPTLKEGLMGLLDLRSVVIVAFQPLRAGPKYSPADAEGPYFEVRARVSMIVISMVDVFVKSSEPLVVWADASSETGGLGLAATIVERSVK